MVYGGANFVSPLISQNLVTNIIFSGGLLRLGTDFQFLRSETFRTRAFHLLQKWYTTQ